MLLDEDDLLRERVSELGRQHVGRRHERAGDRQSASSEVVQRMTAF